MKKLLMAVLVLTAGTASAQKMSALSELQALMPTDTKIAVPTTPLSQPIGTPVDNINVSGREAKEAYASLKVPELKRLIGRWKLVARVWDDADISRAENESFSIYEIGDPLNPNSSVVVAKFDDESTAFPFKLDKLDPAADRVVLGGWPEYCRADETATVIICVGNYSYSYGSSSHSVSRDSYSVYNRIAL